MKPSGIKELFYITHKDNISSMLENGILSHNRILNNRIPFTSIYDNKIVTNREGIKTPDEKSLWEYANLYFQARNPMLFRVIREKSEDNIAVIGVSNSILFNAAIFITNGNAASSATVIWPRSEGIKNLSKMIRKDLFLEYWSDTDGSKRKIMAECLVPDRISPDLIRSIYVATFELCKTIKSQVSSQNIHFLHDPKLFFSPNIKSIVCPNISLVEGDMFFSRFHVLTISVNTVGVMGRGVASRAKYQFPDVYVNYQDLCKRKILVMGKPYLIKRERSLDSDLADDPGSLSVPNEIKWFMLFPTKTDWRNESDIRGIEQGLSWIQSKYQSWGIKSLAMPALGCGLGRLDWKDVGPLMCKYLKKLSIPVQIYLPQEMTIDPKFLTPAYLLK